MSRRKRLQKEAFLPKLLVAVLIAIISSCVLALLGKMLWLGELASHFVMYYAVGCLVIAILLIPYKRFYWASLALVVMLWQSIYLHPHWDAPQISSDSLSEEVTMLQFNVHVDNPNVQEITKWIISQSEDVDIVVLQEVTEKWELAIQRIMWTYPYHISRSLSDGRQIVILSRLLVDELEVKYLSEDAEPVLVMRGATSGYEIPFVLYSTQTLPPAFPSYANKRNALLSGVAEHIAKEELSHKLVVGDLNITRFSPWFDHVLDMSGLKDSGLGLGLINTWPSALPNIFRLQTDHSLVSDNIYVSNRQLGPALGSNHLPILTTFEFLVPEEWQG